MAYIAELDPNSTINLHAEAEAEAFEIAFPNWELAEGYGDRYVSEHSMPLDVIDREAVTDEDWAYFIEATYSEF